MKTLIAIPCMDQVAAPFAQALASLNKDGPTYISMQIGSLIYESRNNFAKQALQLEADAVLWLDSDMIFPPETLQRMLSHLEEGRDIVSGLYFRRRNPFTPVLFKKLDVDGGEHEDYPDYPKDSVFEVEGIGFGCCITRTSVLEDIGLNFSTWFTPRNSLGEDLAFCSRARELGYKIWADTGLKCGHVGQVIVDERVYESSIK